ncbi:acetate/propionate family kinase [Ilyobacter polytropus]|uniref:Acetate kinase n=1 Tax=Ilyobacter polytropus (strain ATCC 51220 / DSM 2926 / LMG 16218 / CuHBu1) TaxID=572544 RepID=E3H6B7_ILYPC|nr:acetate kinase [Ilyobacter polytropus]ADO82330.1 acetate kinase [Ilyobacter polytropus DSM 2926]
MKVLVINCGSSSLKYQLINPESGEVFAIGLCDRIGIHGSKLEFEVPAIDFEIEIEKDMETHKEALEMVIAALTNEEYGVIKTVEEVDAIGHRLVHGGEDFSSSILIDEEVMAAVEANNGLAPLHNPANLMGVRTCMALMPGKPNVGVFDTAFHQTMPAKAYMYALPYADYKDLKVRKYGFHGTSHKFVSTTASEIMGNPEKSKIIVCHLGNGASVSAVKDGECVDTSMGLTPVAGLMMGTRCGDVDPGALIYIKNKRELTDKELDTRINKESGILGIFEKSSDCRDLEIAREKGDERAQLAIDMMTYRIRAYIASYAAAMGGVDMICFTGGIGENSSLIRSESLKGLEFMGVELDQEVNGVRKKGNVKLSKESSKVAIYKIPTNEELVIARDTLEIVNG